MFIYFERERERKKGRERESMSRGGAERERERIPSRLHTVSTEPHAGLDLTKHEIMTRAEIKSQTLNLYGLSHPGAPRWHLLRTVVSKSLCKGACRMEEEAL